MNTELVLYSLRQRAMIAALNRPDRRNTLCG